MTHNLSQQATTAPVTSRVASAARAASFSRATRKEPHYFLLATTRSLLRFRSCEWSLRANIRETPVVPLINEQGEKEKGRDAEAAAAIPGGVGALLRREGLYSSLLTYWKRERADGIREALTPRKRGPKSKHNPMEGEVQKLRRQNARLTEDLRKAHIIIDVQKKVAALLGNPLPETDPDPE